MVLFRGPSLPSQSIDVFVDYAPMDSISDASFLTVSSNDPYLPEALVTQNGLGEIYDTHEDKLRSAIGWIQ